MKEKNEKRIIEPSISIRWLAVDVGLDADLMFPMESDSKIGEYREAQILASSVQLPPEGGIIKVTPSPQMGPGFIRGCD